MAIGVCKLTGIQGKFVKSHLIPQAFTRSEKPSEAFVQSGEGKPAKRRWSSWYDPKLVVTQGEKLLADLDDWAVKFLRHHKLVWSGWGPQRILADLQPLPGNSGWGIRECRVQETTKLRLFLYSLLWRAAATELPEFNEIVLPADDLETLRVAVFEGRLPPIDFYPASFTQLSTLGLIHNQSPLAMTKDIPSIDQYAGQSLPIFRFYFDGLITHFHRHASDNGDTKALGKLIAGQENELVVSTVTYEESFQRKNIERIIADYARDFGARPKPRFNVRQPQ